MRMAVDQLGRQRGRASSWLLAMLVAAIGLLATPVAYAQASPNPESKVHFQRGVKFYSEEDYRAALVEFKRAYELSSNAALLYNIGQTQFQLRDYVRALQSFEKYLSGAPLSTARRQEVEKDIEDLRGRVAKVSVESNVPGVAIALDDVPVGITPLADPIDVSAGARKISATKDGYVPSVRSVEIAGGDTKTVHFDLVPIATEARFAPLPPPSKDERSRSSEPPARGLHPLVFVGYGVGAAGIVTGAVAGLIALGTKNDLDTRCTNHQCPTTERVSHDELKLQATISTIGFGVGLAGAVLGTTFLFVARGTPKSTAVAGVWFGGTSAGLHGTF